MSATSSRPLLLDLMFDVGLKPVEAVLNRRIDDVAEAGELCDRLEGCCCTIEVAPLASREPIRIRLEAYDGQITLTQDDDGGADAEIGGTPIELGRLWLTGRDTPLRDGRVSISGDAQVADDFRRLLRLAEPGIESELAAVGAAGFGSRIGQLIGDLRASAAGAVSAAEARIAGRLRARHLPAAAEVEAFANNVDALGNDLARLEARVSALVAEQRP